MARQSQTPVQFNKTRRKDEAITMTSGRAGKVTPIAYAPLLRGDSASGRVGVDIELAEMPRPVQNAVMANFQAWFVPKSAHPQFSGMDEFRHAYQGEDIKALGSVDRSPPSLFDAMYADGGGIDFANSEFFKTLGLHRTDTGPATQLDLLDAYALIYNFRLNAHSSKLTRAPYFSEDGTETHKLKPAFWPQNRFSRVVADYERALIVGSLELDVAAGQIPINNLVTTGRSTATTTNPDGTDWTGGQRDLYVKDESGGSAWDQVMADMGGQSIGITLADIDKARETQAFAKLMQSYAGNDFTGFDNGDVIVAELMRGFSVDEDDFKRPWLLDSALVPFGMIERHATDAANLDASVSRGRVSATLSLNVPVQDTGGVIIVTCEIVPERLYERQSDEWLHITDSNDYPDALRDVQRPEPVDTVTARRLDMRHTTPDAAYGYEGMNDVWNRSFTRLGGDFYQADPQNPFKEQRAAIWQAAVVDPSFTDDHFLVPDPFPQDVFSATADTDHVWEAAVRHSLVISGITQIGDPLDENNDEYAAIEEAQNDA